MKMETHFSKTIFLASLK